MVEQEAVNFEVTGSSPVRGARIRKGREVVFCWCGKIELNMQKDAKM